MPSPYARQMGDSIARLVALFDDRMPDAEVQEQLYAIASNSARWPEAHRFRSTVRKRLLATNSKSLKRQYHFTESCLESLYNETNPVDPFDSVSPFLVVPNAISLAALSEIPLDAVMQAVRVDA